MTLLQALTHITLTLPVKDGHAFKFNCEDAAKSFLQYAHSLAIPATLSPCGMTYFTVEIKYVP